MADLRDADIWLCATPIGNLAEIPPRLVETLSRVDFILAEDTRVAKKLLSHLDISAEVIRFDAHSAARSMEYVINRVRQGESCALVSDAGTPAISDPGQQLVRHAQDKGFRVSAVSGPSALAVAFSISGIEAKSFYFGGFLPRKAGEISKLFGSLKSLDAALIFYESPQRIVSSLGLASQIFPEREAVVARELTKLHEELVRLPLAKLQAEFEARPSIKGEIVLIIAPPKGKEQLSDEQIAELLRLKLEDGIRPKQAVEEVAAQNTLAKNQVYQVMLKIK